MSSPAQALSSVDAETGKLRSIHERLKGDGKLTEENWMSFWTEFEPFLLSSLDVQQLISQSATLQMAYYDLVMLLFTRRQMETEAAANDVVQRLTKVVINALNTLSSQHYTRKVCMRTDLEPFKHKIRKGWQDFHVRLVLLCRRFQYVSRYYDEAQKKNGKKQFAAMILEDGKKQFEAILLDTNENVKEKLDGEKIELDPKFKSPYTSFEYQLGQKLGAGWSGLVYSCVRLNGEKTFETFAVKFCDSRDDQTTHRSTLVELDLHRRIASSNVVHAEDAFKVNIVLPDEREKAQREDALKVQNGVGQLQYGLPHQFDVCLILEKCETSLESLLKLKPGTSTSDLKSDDKLKLFFGAALGAVAFHQNALIHRDLKPDNILISNRSAKKSDFDPVAKISDFDRVAEVKQPYQSSATAPYAGNEMYASPEKFHFGSYSRRDDVWALGLILARMFAASNPHKFHRRLADVETPQSDSGEVVIGNRPGERVLIDRSAIEKYMDSSTPDEVKAIVRKCLVGSSHRPDIDVLLNDAQVAHIFRRVMGQDPPAVHSRAMTTTTATTTTATSASTMTTKAAATPTNPTVW